MVEGIYATYEIYPRDWAIEAMLEISNLLSRLADKYPCLKGADRAIVMRPGGFKGIILVDLRGHNECLPESAADEIYRLFNEMKERGFIRRLKKLIVFDALVKTDLEEIRNAMERLKHRIKGRWRITPKTRKLVDRTELIKKAAEPIDMPVDLENPEYEVIIQVLGDITGIAIISVEAKSHHETQTTGSSSANVK